MVVLQDNKERQDQLVLVNTRLVALCTNHDSVAADQDKLAAAAEVYKNLLSSVSIHCTQNRVCVTAGL